jgi:hypothetical protein
MSAGSSFHGRRKPNGSACHRRIMAGVQDAAKHAISAMSPLKSCEVEKPLQPEQVGHESHAEGVYLHVDLQNQLGWYAAGSLLDRVPQPNLREAGNCVPTAGKAPSVKRPDGALRERC